MVHPADEVSEVGHAEEDVDHGRDGEEDPLRGQGRGRHRGGNRVHLPILDLPKRAVQLFRQLNIVQFCKKQVVFSHIKYYGSDTFPMICLKFHELLKLIKIKFKSIHFIVNFRKKEFAFISVADPDIF